MYELVQEISQEKLDKYRKLLQYPKWKLVRAEDRFFYTFMLPDQQDTTFFIRIPPGGKVHRHTDTPRPQTTYHIPISTNQDCWNFTYNPDSETHLEVGKVYSIDRQIEHESFNDGFTDRIHLLIETEDLITNALPKPIN